MEKPLISVIVPIYKIERYIGLCIESIINQEYQNLEIILVDDGSPDRCPEICDLYKSKDCRIQVIHKANGGLVSARKAGLLESHGDYVGYVDGDDWIESDFYSTLLVTAVDANADIVIAGHNRHFFGKQESLLNSFGVGVYKDEKLQQFFSQMLSRGPFFKLGVFTYVWNKLFRRELLFEAQMHVDDSIFIGEDACCTYPALLRSKCVVITDNCSYHYRQREDSMLKKSAPFAFESSSIKALYECLIREMKDISSCHNINQQIADFVLSIFIIRSGGLLPTENEFSRAFPFDVDICNKRVAIYSAGTFGQQLRTRLKEAELCEVVGWFDDDYWEYRRCCLDVDSVESVSTTCFDYLLIATVDSQAANKIKNRIVAFGIEANRVLTITCTAEQRLKALSIYLGN